MSEPLTSPDHAIDYAEMLARSVPCPVCDALPGMGCYRNDGGSGARIVAHIARYRAFNEANGND